MSPTYRLEAMLDSIWRGLLEHALFVVGAIVLLMLGALFVEGVKLRLAGTSVASDGPPIALSQRVMRILAAASAVHAPLTHATRSAQAMSDVPQAAGDPAPAAGMRGRSDLLDDPAAVESRR